MAAIKNILFDFGNVLFDIDLPAIERNMRLLLGESFEQSWERIQRERILELYETGGLSTEEFVETIRLSGAKPIPAGEVIAAWNSIFISLPRHRLDLMLELRQRYKVFLLSNINDLHERWVSDYVQREHGISDYESRYFDGVYFSHLVRLRKPDPAIFEYALADAEILPQETVFFDDLPANVAAANGVGIQSFVHPLGMEIGEHVKKVLLP